MENDTKIEAGHSVAAHLLGGFLLGLVFWGAAYAYLYFGPVYFSLDKGFLPAMRTLHQKYAILVILDSLPVCLAIVGLLLGLAHKRGLSSLRAKVEDLKRQNQQLRTYKFLYSVMFEKTNDCLIITTPQGDIVDLNEGGARLLEIDSLSDEKPDSKEARMKILKNARITAKSIYVNEEDRHRILEELNEKGSISNVQIPLRRFNGETFDAIFSGFLGEIENGQPLIFGRIIDLGDMKQAELLLRKANEQLEKKNKELLNAFSELQTLKVRFENRNKDLERLNQRLDYANKMLSKLAITDGLTGLYNHKHFMELLKKEWERSQRSKRSFCVIMIDVDYFKSFNDKYGHQLGDQALKSLAKTIRSQTRSYDIVARYGGEEFGLILPETDLNTCYTVAQRIRKAVEKKTLYIKSQDVKVHLTVSVGVTIFLPEEDDSRTFEQVLQDSDVALYLAKNQGRNKVEMYRRDVLSESAKVVPIPELNGEE